MTAPTDAPAQSTIPEPGRPLEILQRRPAFLAVAATAKRAAAPGVVIQRRFRTEDEVSPVATVRFGLTASKKVGNAVARNRARRRLRALAWDILPRLPRDGIDLVLIARSATVGRPADRLRADFLSCLKRLGLAPVPDPTDRREGHGA